MLFNINIIFLLQLRNYMKINNIWLFYINVIDQTLKGRSSCLKLCIEIIYF